MGTFAGDTAENYARYRREYPNTIVAAVIGHLGLGPDDTVIDLGCGTGLLTAPVARNVGLVVGVDPEADMLAIARRQAEPGINSKVVWVLGTDDDLPAVARLLGDGSVGAVTVGQALHFMDYENLFLRARRLLRPGGGIAVIANGVPLWQQDSQWSRCLRMALDAWFRTTTTATCGTDRATQARYANALSAAGYEVHEVVEEYEADLTLEEVLGGLRSAMSPGDVPGGLRDAFAEHITAALPGPGGVHRDGTCRRPHRHRPLTSGRPHRSPDGLLATPSDPASRIARFARLLEHQSRSVTIAGRGRRARSDQAQGPSAWLCPCIKIVLSAGD